MNWFRKWFPKKKSVLLHFKHGDWVQREAQLTASGWIVVLWPGLGDGVHLLLDDGKCVGHYCDEWLPV